MTTKTTPKSRRIHPRTTSLLALAAAMLLAGSVSGCAMEVGDAEAELDDAVAADEAAWEAGPEVDTEPMQARDPRSFGLRAWSPEAQFDPTGPLHGQRAHDTTDLVGEADVEWLDDGAAVDGLDDPSVTVTP